MIPIAEPSIGEKELANAIDCIKSGWISSLGKYIPQFQDTFAAYCGVRHGVATSNGTTALHLALAVLDIGPGDEVLVPALTFIATANAVTYTGAKPVFVDSENATWNIDPARLEEKITPRTKAIIPVHIYGHPVDMDPLLEVARRHALYVIEDAAEAHGARYKGRRTGSLGDMACFSFYGNKIITTGEGGMIVTDNREWAERAAFLRDHGMSKEKRYWHTAIGYNYRMTNLQAAIGVAQMERIDEFVAKKRSIAELYNSLLAKVPGITLPPEAPWAVNVYWMYSLQIQEDYGMSRDELMVRLKERDIDSRPFFYPLHTLPSYATGERLTVAEALAAKGINLPSSVTLTPTQIETVCGALAELGMVKSSAA